MMGGWARTWSTWISSAWTAQSGFSVSLSSDCAQNTGVQWFAFNWTFEYNFSYTVKSNTTGQVVKTGNCSFSQFWDHGPMGIPEKIDRTVQISSAP